MYSWLVGLRVCGRILRYVEMDGGGVDGFSDEPGDFLLLVKYCLATYSTRLDFMSPWAWGRSIPV